MKGSDYIMFDEKNYPMTYKEFEEKVVNLYLDALNDEQLEIFLPLLEEELKKSPCFIQTIYGQTCFEYDNPDIFGEIVKHSFEDEFLKRNVVPQIEKFIG